MGFYGRPFLFGTGERGTGGSENDFIAAARYFVDAWRDTALYLPATAALRVVMAGEAVTRYLNHRMLCYQQ